MWLLYTFKKFSQPNSQTTGQAATKTSPKLANHDEGENQAAAVSEGNQHVQFDDESQAKSIPNLENPFETDSTVLAINQAESRAEERNRNRLDVVDLQENTNSNNANTPPQGHVDEAEHEPNIEVHCGSRTKGNNSTDEPFNVSPNLFAVLEVFEEDGSKEDNTSQFEALNIDTAASLRKLYLPLTGKQCETKPSSCTSNTGTYGC